MAVDRRAGGSSKHPDHPGRKLDLTALLVIPLQTAHEGGSHGATVTAVCDTKNMELMESGEFTPVIDRTYPLERIVEAYRYVETGQKIGNVVIVLTELRGNSVTFGR
jgi:NADPH:quinone reductase-like Zn-dependent oxidoreductase